MGFITIDNLNSINAELSNYCNAACPMCSRYDWDLNLVKDKTITLIEVSDTQESLIKLAKHIRKKNTKFKVICITGSSGKTTLKDWLSQVLNKELNIYSNPGNFNNHIGMPLSLINIPQKTQICILELGMNNYGEIKKLAEIAKPHIAIVTNVGNAHIGNFKSSLEIANEKSDIFKYHNKNDDNDTNIYC